MVLYGMEFFERLKIVAIMKQNVVIIIPARYASTRLPGKPLVNINGKPLIQMVYERASGIKKASEIIIATDDRRIEQAVKGFAARVVMTPSNLRSGSERVGFVAKTIDADIVMNLQGDEPLIPTEAVDEAIRILQNDAQLNVSTLACPLTTADEWRNPSVVKVLVNSQMDAIYFSRSAIPFFRDSDFRPVAQLLKHIGVYIYRKEFLMRLLDWDETPLERVEKLEQLRILEHGQKIRVIKSEKNSFGVDTPEDVAYIEKLIKDKGTNL